MFYILFCTYVFLESLLNRYSAL